MATPSATDHIETLFARVAAQEAARRRTHRRSSPVVEAPTGSYRVRLTVNGQTLQGSLVVRADPEAGKLQ